MTAIILAVLGQTNLSLLSDSNDLAILSDVQLVRLDLLNCDCGTGEFCQEDCECTVCDGEACFTIRTGKKAYDDAYRKALSNGKDLAVFSGKGPFQYKVNNLKGAGYEVAVVAGDIRFSDGVHLYKNLGGQLVTGVPVQRQSETIFYGGCTSCRR